MNVFEHTNSTEALPHLAQVVMTCDEIGARGGKRTRELLYPQIELTQPWQREVLTPGRKVNIAAQIAETMWVLAGLDDIGWLSNYLPRAKDFSDDGKTWRAAYGPRLRNWGGVDQLQEVVDLLKGDTTTRRAVINLFDPQEDFQLGTKDVPCNNWLHFLNRKGALDLHVAVRSNDLIWGWSGINAFEWSAVQEIVASLLNVSVGRLIFSTSSLHVYEQHYGKANRIANADLGWYSVVEDSPRADVQYNLRWFDECVTHWFHLEQAIRGERPYTQDAIDTFPEPMLRSWLRVIQWYWTGDTAYLKPLEGTRLATAALLTPTSLVPGYPKPEAETPAKKTEKVSFVQYATELHEGKDEAYGDSWIRRGEMLGVLANLARKVDRLGVSGGGDTELDTATDLLLYLCKYRVWLDGQARTGAYHRNLVKGRLEALAKRYPSVYNGKRPKTLEDMLRVGLNNLEDMVANKESNRTKTVQVQGMMEVAYQLAARLYHRQGNNRRAWNPEAGQ